AVAWRAGLQTVSRRRGDVNRVPVLVRRSEERALSRANKGIRPVIVRELYDLVRIVEALRNTHRGAGAVILVGGATYQVEIVELNVVAGLKEDCLEGNWVGRGAVECVECDVIPLNNELAAARRADCLGLNCRCPQTVANRQVVPKRGNGW